MNVFGQAEIYHIIVNKRSYSKRETVLTDTSEATAQILFAVVNNMLLMSSRD